MRLILAHYLRTLRERHEFDRLLAELLVSMGYIPLFKPQAGVRQFGVDFAAVGNSPDDDVREILLFVIREGDIGRREWSAQEPADLRPSLNEILDVFLATHIPPEHAALRKVVVVATTGEFKKDISQSWKGFVDANQDKVSFEVWHGVFVASLLERYLLNENLFADEDRQDLRKALALSCDRDYAFGDFLSLLRRQLGLERDGSLTASPANQGLLLKAIQRVILATQVCAHWAQSEGDRRQALWVFERALLWVWHRIQLSEPSDRPALYRPLGDMWAMYQHMSQQYLEAMHQHFLVRDGMSSYCRESAEYSIVLFEHIGIVATIGLCQAMALPTTQEEADLKSANASAIGGALWALITNNSASGSPRLDRHATEITLALALLVSTNRHAEAAEWLANLACRLHFSFLRKSMFPICTDSLDDLVDFEVDGGEDAAGALMNTSWMLPTIAAWCALQGLDDFYALLAKGSAEDYANVCGQLWHPTPEWPQRWYFRPVQWDLGDTEAPYALPTDSAELLARIDDFKKIKHYDWMADSPALSAGLWALDVIACRHFRVPVPASFWYRLARKGSDAGGMGAGAEAVLPDGAMSSTY
ncbi:MAG: hypothetical protein Q8R06_13805 [Polaromonas sp.]|uniref:hypothetical protein n=1 Tax=Polaromonas sp. TaxID=1869339 RepID=UPI0027340DCF|nr:hypothetical protein [Polaromonas sp.]MDP3798201.1 hypothetical protein [Polaromonas sp.]